MINKDEIISKLFMQEIRCHSNARSLLCDTKVRVENAQQEEKDRSSKYNFILIPSIQSKGK